MTYKVFGGTLSLTQSINHQLDCFFSYLLCLSFVSFPFIFYRTVLFSSK